MKRILSVLILSQVIISISFGQNSVVSSGSDAQGTGGTVAYSIGQVDYTSVSNNQGVISEGVQQAFEIFTITSVDDFSTQVEMEIYPNPTTGFLILEQKDHLESELNYSLLDINGKQLMSNELTDSKTKLDLSLYASATYFLIVYKDKQAVKSFKIIKNN